MINKEMLNKLVEMPDEKLMQMLRVLLSGTGIDLGTKRSDAAEIKKLRALLREITDSDIERVIYLSGVYKKG